MEKALQLSHLSWERQIKKDVTIAPIVWVLLMFLLATKKGNKIFLIHFLSVLSALFVSPLALIVIFCAFLFT